MLTATQVETVALLTDDGIICLDCATRRFGEFGVEAIIEGLAEFLPQDVSRFIRYELDELIGQDASEHAYEVAGPEPNDARQPLAAEEWGDRWQQAYDDYPDEYPCDNCGRGIS